MQKAKILFATHKKILALLAWSISFLLILPEFACVAVPSSVDHSEISPPTESCSLAGQTRPFCSGGSSCVANVIVPYKAPRSDQLESSLSSRKVNEHFQWLSHIYVLATNHLPRDLELKFQSQLYFDSMQIESAFNHFSSRYFVLLI